MQFNTILDIINTYNAPHPRALASTFDTIISGVGIYEVVLINGIPKELEATSSLDSVKAIRIFRLVEGTDNTYLSGELYFPFTQNDLENCLTKKVKHKAQNIESNKTRSIMPKLDEQFYYHPDELESADRLEVLSEIFSEDIIEDEPLLVND